MQRGAFRLALRNLDGPSAHRFPPRQPCGMRPTPRQWSRVLNRSSMFLFTLMLGFKYSQRFAEHVTDFSKIGHEAGRGAHRVGARGRSAQRSGLAFEKRDREGAHGARRPSACPRHFFYPGFLKAGRSSSEWFALSANSVPSTCAKIQ